MKTRTLLLLLMVLGLLLVACGSAEEPVVEEPAAVVEPAEVEQAVEEVVQEPAEEMVEETAVEVAEVDLDAVYGVFLGDMEAYNTVGIDALNEMFVNGTAPFLLDVREPSELEEHGWIEGAVNIPLRQVADNIDYLPSFDTTIVSYCGSGWRCTIALTALEAMGWQDVRGLKGGSFGGWKDAGYPFVEGAVPELVALNEAEPDPALVTTMREMLHSVPDGFGVVTADVLNMELVDNTELILIDVRRPEEVETKGSIDAANVLFIPLEEFVAQQRMWPADLDAPIVVSCGSGHRSTIAMSILWSYGYTDVRSLKGGFGGWVTAGYPAVGVPETEAMVDLDGAFSVFLDDMVAYNTISLEDLNLMLAEDPPPFVLDVRNASEIEEHGYIETAVHIPLREIADHIEWLPSFDTTIVSYCGSGWRCTIALTALEALGWQDVRCLKGGSFGGWKDAGYPVAEGMPLAPMELNVADPDLALLTAVQDMLHNVPDGYGVITADDLFLQLGENPDLVLMDARRLEEVEEKGVIETGNLIHIPLEQFVVEKDKWPADMDTPIVVYCGSGHRSTIAMSILWAYGYADVFSLKGGFGGWAEAGYPVVEYAMP